MSTTTLEPQLEEVQLSTYDEVPYQSNPFPQTHPDRLATIGRLFGMDTAPVDNCRVLELGCASGGNIIPLAYSYPNSEIVGVDLSKHQIDDGCKRVESLGLKNCQLKHLNIEDIDENLGKFDYIICHGVFSWVPDNVRDRILDVCNKNLTPNGIAYISYNTYPGWHYKGMIRDMMLYHTSGIKDANKKAEADKKVFAARQLLGWLSKSVPTDKDNVYGVTLKRELDLINVVRNDYFFHEYLEDANSPVYFQEFAAMADKHDLQYLGEAEFSTMLTSNFSKEVADTLRGLAGDIIKTEQYMDFVRNRQFRQTLLCHKDVKLNRNVGFNNVMSLHVCCPAKPIKDENGEVPIKTAAPVTFVGPDGTSTIRSAVPLVKAALVHLAEVWPQSVPFDELVSQARARISDVLIQDANSFQRDAQILGADMLQCYTVRLVGLRTQKAGFETELSEKPQASDLVRHQCKQETTVAVTNQLHENIPVDAFVRHILALLDGTRTKDQILSELVKLGQAGTLVVQKEGKPVKDEAVLRELLATALDEKFAVLPKAAVLVK